MAGQVAAAVHSAISSGLPAYRGDIVQASARYHVPADLLASQIRQESGFNPNAVSPAGAIGISQFMPGTARGFGIDPHNPHQSIQAQAKYDAELKNQLGSWQLALAGYNAGPGNAAHYQSIPETRNYVASVEAGRSAFPGLAASQGTTQAPQPVRQAPRPRSVDVSALSAPISLDTQPMMANPVQSLLDESAKLAGVSAPVLPNLPLPATQTSPVESPAPHASAPAPAPAVPTPFMHDQYLRPVTGGKVIGTPYQGTHATAFNVAGGSNNWESENAVDIATRVGTPIVAVRDGVIGSQFGSLGEGGRFAGLRLHLRTGANEFYYAHLSGFAPGIKPGVRVHAGQVIGYSGEANGVAHLHIAAQNGNPLDLFHLNGGK